MYISSLMESYRSDLTQFFRFISVNDVTGKFRDPGHFFREINTGKITRDPGRETLIINITSLKNEPSSSILVFVQEYALLN